MLSARLVAFALALGVIAAVLAGIYLVVALLAGWPTPF